MRVLTCRQVAYLLKCRQASHHSSVNKAVTDGAIPRRSHLNQNSKRNAHITQASAAPPSDVGSAPSTSAPPPKRLAVFVSGGGSNFRAIHAAILDGSINAQVAAVVTNAPSCGGANYARDHGIPVLVHPQPKTNPSAGLSPDALADSLKNKYQADFLILAGYMKLVPADLVRAYRRAILNIHPGLLPSFGGKGFYGTRVHQAVIEAGARFSGPTVHFVDEEYDTGPILAQAVVPVLPTDSAEMLAGRVLKEEHKLYPKCVSALCDGRVTWRYDGIPIMWSAH